MLTDKQNTPNATIKSGNYTEEDEREIRESKKPLSMMQMQALLTWD